MTLDEYQERAMSTCMESCENESYMLLGLQGEVGELASKYAKAIRKGLIAIKNNEALVQSADVNAINEFREGVMGEIGDCLWFIAGITEQCGLSLEQVAEYNLSKLSSRKQRGVIEGNGDNR